MEVKTAGTVTKQEGSHQTAAMRKEEGKDYILPKNDREMISLDPELAYSSPFMKNKAGSKVVEVSYGDRVWKYDFEKDTISEGPR